MSEENQMLDAIDHVIVIDAETGGLSPERNAILSVALVTTHESLELKIADTTGELDSRAMEVNGIDPEKHFAEAIPMDLAAELINEFIHGVYRRFGEGQKLWLAGHNIAFDLGFLGRLFRLAGVKPVRLIGPHRTIDTHTLLWAKAAAGDIPYEATSSDGAFKHYNIFIPEGERHTALGDARATLQLLRQLTNL